MPFDLSDTQFTGPALPEPFVKFELENELTKLKLLPKTTGAEGKQLKEDWDAYRRHLAQLAVRGGSLRVRNQAIEPLCKRLGYTGEIESAPDVETREGREDGGYLLTADGAKLRVWTTDLDEDIDAPAKRGQAYRFSHLRIAQRVLLASGERVGLLTNGVELRLLISDPARPDSQVIFTLDPNWKRSRDVPDSFRLFLALVSPNGVQKIPELVDKARLQQARVTKDLRDQARQAIGRFIQELLDHPDNRGWLVGQQDHQALAKALWHEGLIVVYRLLFVLKLESSDDPARSFTFASTSLWRNTFSPTMALARYAPKVLYDGAETGGLLEHGLRGLFRMFHEGVECTELNVKPLGGSLFGADTTPVLSQLRWGERAVAHLLDQLLWTTPKKRSGARERVHYGPLDVEDLGRVYEALLELEPGIAGEPMCRLRRQKLEVVVPIAQGAKYRPAKPVASDNEDEQDVDEPEEEEEDEDDSPKRGKKTTVQWIEEIPPKRFYLRVGLGRKATGSYYTPHSFVRFLVQETLGPQVVERSPPDDPQPCEILKLKVFDPACGSGHFLVEACRFLGQHLYEAARLCDEQAIAAEHKAETAKRKEDREAALAEAQKYRQRVSDLPDPDDELLRYLPSRSVEGEQPGLSQRRAEALCRRMVAVHCLYGVDKNPLAVELAKLALWLESHAEGMPLTFLDHRIVTGDSLTGPFWNNLITRPSDPKEPVEGVFHQGLSKALEKTLHKAIRYVGDLEATVGISQAEIENKKATKVEMDRALRPFRIIASAWSGGVMLGPKKCDDFGYAELLKSVATTGDLPVQLPSPSKRETGAEEYSGNDQGDGGLRAMISHGLGLDAVPNERDAIYALLESGRCIPALNFELTFPEVFYPKGVPYQRLGFDAILGNPPWDTVRPKSKEFFAGIDFDILAAPTKRERAVIEKRLKSDPQVASLHKRYEDQFSHQHRVHEVIFTHQVVMVNGEKTGGDPDLAKLFMERSQQLLRKGGWTGLVVPSAFHANEGATGVRRLFLDNMTMSCCYSFENRRKLFEIDSRFKFALVTAQAGIQTERFSCAFFLHDDEWLFGDRDQRQPLEYTHEFVRRTGGDTMSFVELRTNKDLEVAQVCFNRGEPFARICSAIGVSFGRELHMTDDAWRFKPTSEVVDPGEDPRDPEVTERLLATGYLILHEGKTFRQYEDRWGDAPRYLVPVANLADKSDFVRNATFYRLAHRKIAGPGDENISIWSMHAPGATHGDSCPVECRIQRANVNCLGILAVLNSVPFDYLLGLRVRANVLGFMRDSQPFPWEKPVSLFAHGALRLTCNHSGYAPLWREQVGEAWRETGESPMTWPVLAGDDKRWAVRAAIDAVVADAYGLSRDQYAHVLSTFSHASYRKAPELCLARFDELKDLGLDKFTRKHDPYWDIPLNENLPQPVIDLPIPTDETAKQTDDGLWKERSGQISFVSPGPLFDQQSGEPPKRGRRKK